MRTTAPLGVDARGIDLARAHEPHPGRVELGAGGVGHAREEACQRAVEHVEKRHLVRAGNRRRGLGADQGGANHNDVPVRHGQAPSERDENTTSLFTATLEGLGPVGEGSHASDERIDTSRLPERAALPSLLLLERATRPRRAVRRAVAA